MSETPENKPLCFKNEDGLWEISGPTPEEKLERKKMGARFGHIKRRILRNERLTGELLELALSVLPEDTRDKYTGDIARKLNVGEQLTEYEAHLMVDVILRR